jgi:hypothetical protein
VKRVLVVWGSNEKHVAKASQHQRAERVVNHWFVVNWQ